MIVLTALEKDALAEAFNVALGAASATFAEVVQTEVQMSVPAVDLLTREELIARLASLPSPKTLPRASTLKPTPCCSFPTKRA
jgi:chemotaxis protein CheC